MLVFIEFNASQNSVFEVEEMRLTKSNKSSIKERAINKLENKDLSSIAAYRGADVRRLSNKETEEHEDYKEYITKL